MGRGGTTILEAALGAGFAAAAIGPVEGASWTTRAKSCKEQNSADKNKYVDKAVRCGRTVVSSWRFLSSRRGMGPSQLCSPVRSWRAKGQGCYAPFRTSAQTEPMDGPKPPQQDPAVSVCWQAPEKNSSELIKVHDGAKLHVAVAWSWGCFLWGLSWWE